MACDEKGKETLDCLAAWKDPGPCLYTSTRLQSKEQQRQGGKETPLPEGVFLLLSTQTEEAQSVNGHP